MIDDAPPRPDQVDGFKLGVNYGWNKVRFPAPIPAGSACERAESCPWTRSAAAGSRSSPASRSRSRAARNRSASRTRRAGADRLRLDAGRLPPFDSRDDAFPALRTLVGRFDPTRLRRLPAAHGSASPSRPERPGMPWWRRPAPPRGPAPAARRRGLKADAVDWRDRPRRRAAWTPSRPAGSRSAATSTWASASWRRPATTSRPLRFRSRPDPARARLDPRGRPGAPILLLHGLGATKAEFLPTVRLWPTRVIAMDLPGFGDTDKPFPAPYDPPFFAELGRVGAGRAGDRARPRARHSMGGRVAIEFGCATPTGRRA